MLVLSRKKNETIMIGDDIEITVVDIQGDQVRLGIRAPKDVAVHRQEIYRAIEKANRQAAQADEDGLEAFRRIWETAGVNGKVHEESKRGDGDEN